MEQRPRKLLDQVRDVLRLKHYSIRTEEAYVTGSDTTSCPMTDVIPGR